MGMARVVIIGASKGIGLETTRQALEAGHMVRAFARSAADISISDPKLEKVRGNALRSNDVLVEPDARPCLCQDHLQRGLAALKWIMPQVIAV
jgi:NAD(P)-dependent dehydrogenase (short-subunit alcohol dehydrogenase family)